jgi:HK97 family phage major capsid protein
MQGPRSVNEKFLDEARAMFQGETRSLSITAEAQDIARMDEEIRKGHYEERVLLTTTSGVSPGVIPISFLRTIREYLFLSSAIRRTNVTVLNTAGGEPLRVPRRTALPTAGIIGEGATKTESLPTFDSVVLGAYKYANLTQISEEFLQDEIGGVLNLLARDNAQAIGLANGAHMITGNGTTAPQGVVTALVAAGGRQLTGAATSGNVTAIAAEELIKIYHGVIEPYRQRAYWLMNDATVASIRGVREGSGATAGNFLWQPGLQAGMPDLLLGKPVVSDPGVATMAASANAIVFGDFSGYYIRDVAGFRFERSDDYAFANDLVTFRAVLRTDAKLIDPLALVVWRNAAT